MKASDIYNAWAPTNGTWSPWVKPVLFAESHRAYVERRAGLDPFPEVPKWFDDEVQRPLEERAESIPHDYRSAHAPRDVALVIDLPSDQGVKLGAALSSRAFRPVPLYNAAPGPRAIVAVGPIIGALERAVPYLAEIPAAAAPAFLLDASRNGEGVRVGPGLFDNRSICRSSDFPSAERLQSAGVRRIVILCDAVQDDLRSVALEWQSAGLEIWLKRPSQRRPAVPERLRRPWFGERMWIEFRHAVRKPGADGLYGKMINEPSSSS